MTKITVLSLGTRGDVQPIIALGKGLGKAGYGVTVAAKTEFEELVTHHGLLYSSLNPEIEEAPQFMDTKIGKHQESAFPTNKRELETFRSHVKNSALDQNLLVG